MTTLNLFDKHLIPAFVDCSLDSVTRFDCQQWINRKAREGFSESVVHHCRTHLSAVMKEAVRQRYLDHNPADGLSIPETSAPSKRYLTADGCRRLAAALVNPRDRLIFRLCILCGLRAGECFALRWDDHQGPSLRIDESLEGTSTRVGTPKTPSSAAPVILCSSLAADLDNWRMIRQPPYERDFLFGPGRRPMSYAAWLRDVLQPIAKGVGIHGVTFQCLRRTFSTLAQRHGSPKDIQAQMRHSDVATTLGVYQQVIPESVRVMVEALDAELMPPEDKPN